MVGWPIDDVLGERAWQEIELLASEAIENEL